MSAPSPPAQRPCGRIVPARRTGCARHRRQSGTWSLDGSGLCRGRCGRRDRQPQIRRLRRGRAGSRKIDRSASTAVCLPCRALGRAGRLVDAAYAEFGQVDILVNNAGMSPLYEHVTDVTERLWDATVGVNLKGPFRLTSLVGTRMVEAGHGSIINISTIGAIHPAPDIVPYSASKAGLNAMTIAFAHTFGPAVRVNCIMPGGFRTDISKAWDWKPSTRTRSNSHSDASVSRTRSSAPRSISPVMRPATPPARCFQWTAACPPDPPAL